ncbi:MAG: phospho-N-acetylmuramoyl-pentapeptide-transferase [Rhodobacteraceae bacterium]|nr:phospho-N-acetylmuramoyl-pentapeptide-transferase [Paracoccaceae bacterium]
MLQLLAEFAQGGDFFNLFRYITVRASGALITALAIVFLCGLPMIRLLRRLQPSGQPLRELGPDHATKSGTPTMGGVLIIGAVVLSTLLWARLDNAYVWMVLLATMTYSALGVLDDLYKIRASSSDGMTKSSRFAIGLLIGCAVGAMAMYIHPEHLSGVVAFPIFKDWLLALGLAFVPFAALVVVGSANAVNLTDGLDGLAIVPVMIAAGTLGIIAYAVGRVDFTDYLDVHYVPGTGELLVVASALIGAGLGFLWYNAPPAAVFMGDSGSLGLGSAVGTIAVLTKHEIVFAVVGGLFVVEALSVIIQVAYFRRTGKRIFLMAPIHHHFEKRGWTESQIVIRFWIIALLLGMIGLATLKVR